MGVEPRKQGNLYQFQIDSLEKEYHEKKRFNAMLAGAKLK